MLQARALMTSHTLNEISLNRSDSFLKGVWEKIFFFKIQNFDNFLGFLDAFLINRFSLKKDPQFNVFWEMLVTKTKKEKEGEM